MSTTCERLAGVIASFGYASVSCASAAGGGCMCSATVRQTGGIGLVSPDPQLMGTYKTSGNVVTLDDQAKYSNCVSGNKMTWTPQSTSPTTTGAVVFQKSGSPGSGGATGYGGGVGSSGRSVTTLSGSKPLNTLTTAEATKLCSDTYDYFGSAIPQATACKWKGLSYAVSSRSLSQGILRSNCTSKETPCLAANPGAVWSNSVCGNLPPSCMATVGEYTTCISDKVADFNKAVSGLQSCAELTGAGLSAVWIAMTADPSASCESLNNKCPDLDVPSPYQ